MHRGLVGLAAKARDRDRAAHLGEIGQAADHLVERLLLRIEHIVASKNMDRQTRRRPVNHQLVAAGIVFWRDIAYRQHRDSHVVGAIGGDGIGWHRQFPALRCIVITQLRGMRATHGVGVDLPIDLHGQHVVGVQRDRLVAKIEFACQACEHRGQAVGEQTIDRGNICRLGLDQQTLTHPFRGIAR